MRIASFWVRSGCDLKAVQMNVQCSLIQELILCKFELDYNAAETTKNIPCIKSEGTVDHSTATRWLKKFHFDCKNFDDQACSGSPKTGFQGHVPSHRGKSSK